MNLQSIYNQSTISLQSVYNQLMVRLVEEHYERARAEVLEGGGERLLYGSRKSRVLAVAPLRVLPQVPGVDSWCRHRSRGYEQERCLEQRLRIEPSLPFATRRGHGVCGFQSRK